MLVAQVGRVQVKGTVTYDRRSISNRPEKGVAASGVTVQIRGPPSMPFAFMRAT